MNRFVTNRYKWSTGQGHETINFGVQEVRGQGHTTLKLDLEAWRRHHSRPLRRSIRFRSFIYIVMIIVVVGMFVVA